MNCDPAHKRIIVAYDPTINGLRFVGKVLVLEVAVAEGLSVEEAVMVSIRVLMIAVHNVLRTV